MKGLYERAVIPQPFVIMGRELQPFSFGHFLILRRFKVGFVSDEKADITLEDIIFSILVCSHSYKECVDLLYRNGWKKTVKTWRKYVRKECERAAGVGFFESLLRRIFNRPITKAYIDFGDIAARFMAYMDYHTERPWFKPRKASKEETLETNAEWYEPIIKTLMGKCNYTHAEVMDMPFSRALYEHLSYLEQQGLITFYNERQQKQLAAILDEKKKAKESNAASVITDSLRTLLAK